MRQTDTIVIGAGQAGLAASKLLTERGHDHVVLEQGRIGRRWREETWDSLHLLTPNWFNGLPGRRYDGPEPDGFMTATAFADSLAAYAHSFDAPVEQRTVEGVQRHGDGLEVVTESDVWRTSNVILATGWCDQPSIPAFAGSVGGAITQVAPRDYRRPEALPPGGVLVVGASATGVQLADELRAAGRDVTLAVGSHSRLPRRYRGMDIFWWLSRIGALDKTIDEVPDRVRARHEPSLQLVGGRRNRSLDLATLQAAGVRLVGRVAGVDGCRVHLAADLRATLAAAETRMTRVLTTIDQHIENHGLGGEVLAPEPIRSLTPPTPPSMLDLRAAGITVIVWATGHRRPYGWLRIPVLDPTGEVRQRRGVTPVPGLYTLGQRFQHYRSSNFIGGVGRDATYIVEHITGARHPHPSMLSTR